MAGGQRFEGMFEAGRAPSGTEGTWTEPGGRYRRGVLVRTVSVWDIQKTGALLLAADSKDGGFRYRSCAAGCYSGSGNVTGDGGLQEIMAGSGPVTGNHGVSSKALDPLQASDGILSQHPSHTLHGWPRGAEARPKPACHRGWTLRSAAQAKDSVESDPGLDASRLCSWWLSCSAVPAGSQAARKACESNEKQHQGKLAAFRVESTEEQLVAGPGALAIVWSF